MQMQLRSTDLKFIILGIVVAHCAAEKEVNKRKKTFWSIIYLHLYTMFKS